MVLLYISSLLENLDYYSSYMNIVFYTQQLYVYSFDFTTTDRFSQQLFYFSFTYEKAKTQSNGYV